MSLSGQVLLIWFVAAVVMSVAWGIARRVANLGYVDVFWAGCMMVAALLAGLLGNGDQWSRALVALFGGIWGARLCLYLLNRVLREPEDGRYVAMRRAIGTAGWKWFLFFQAQAVVVGLFAIPFVAAAAGGHDGFDGTVIAASAIWLLAMGGEWLADHQLDQHRRVPCNRGTTCRRGLWGWSRHPNYFFEWLHWFAYVCLAWGGEWWIWSWLGPVLMFAFLYRVSGIPWVEAQALRSRGDDYRRYQAEVSAFLPWPPRH